MIELDEAAALVRRRAHQDRVDRLLSAHLARQRVGVRHPVDDFLFTYYSYRPRALRSWHPGIGVAVTGAAASEFDGRRGYLVADRRAHVAPDFVNARRSQISWIGRLLAATADRQPVLGCFGMHEWAMVYGQPPDDLRHSTYPLRLGAEATDAVVESHRITCTHFDAFRFFTDGARPLNALSPTRETQHANDQPGCLHAGMDLYKWAYKLAPLTSAELVVDCFELARDIRQIDMAAAPYDLSSLGVEPIRIETTEGKVEYVAAQRAFAARAQPLRQSLVDICDRALHSAVPA